MAGKRKDAYKRSKRFIYYLKKLMADVIKGMDAETYSVLSKNLMPTKAHCFTKLCSNEKNN